MFEVIFIAKFYFYFKIKARFYYESGKVYSLFLLLMFFLLCLALASILSAERSITETKNAKGLF